jgi:TPR repeat protein
MGFIVFLAIAGGIGYFIYKKFFANKTQNENNFAQTNSSSPREQEIEPPEPALGNEEIEESIQNENIRSSDASQLAQNLFRRGDYANAVQYYKKAMAETKKDGLCDAVLDVFYENLGEIYADINGDLYDIEKARYWYQKAASLGNDLAIDALKNLK